MAQTSINVRMDEDLKIEFETLCKDLGLTMSSAINVFAKQMVRSKAMPFPVSMNIPNAETIEAINEIEALIKDPTEHKGYTSVEELFEDLLK